MVLLRRYDPLRELHALQERMNRMFEESGKGARGREEENLAVAWTPAVDIHETAAELIVRAELPGVPREGVQVEVKEGVLTLRGERKSRKEVREENYHRMECSYGAFYRSFALPSNLDPEKVDASLKDGVLEVRVAKKESARPKKIDVKAA